MVVFLLLVGKLIPLYALIGLGYVAGKRLKVAKEAIAKLQIYIIVPVVVFHGTIIAQLDRSVLALPVVFYVIAVTLCLLSYFIGGFVFRDSTRNIQAFAAGTGNTGYFAIPVAISLFGEKAFPLVVIANFGLLMYEATLGLFMVARGSFGVEDSIKKVFGMPLMYAFAIGLLLNMLHVQAPQALLDMALNFRGAYTVLGMMIIGLGLAGLKNLSLDGPFLCMAFIAKFVLWPAIMLGIIAVDRAHFGLFSTDVRNIMIVLSIVPMAANTVLYATEMRVHPEKAATAVALTTLFTLVYIPVMVTLFVR